MARVKLGEVATEYKGTYKGDKTGIPVVGLEHLIPQDITLSQWDVDTENTFTKAFRKGHVLFGRRRAYLKKAALAPFAGICSGDITVIEAIEEKLYPDLLPFIIQNDFLFDYAVEKSAGSLSPRVKWEHLKDFEFELPEYAEQKRLSELLWASYRSKEAYQNLLKKTDELVKSQFIEMFGKGNYPSVPIGVLLQQNTSTERIVDTLDERYITVALYGKGLRERNIEKYDPKPFSGYRVAEKQFIYSRIDARNGAFGIVPHELHNAVVSKDFPVFDIDYSRISGEFLLCSVLDDGFINQIQRSSLGATNRQRIKEEVFLAYHITLPPIEMQQQFATFVQQLDKSKFEIQKNIESINELIKSLMNQYMN